MRQVILIILLLKTIVGIAQSINVPLDADLYHRIDRYEANQGRTTSSLFTSIKPYARKNVVAFWDTLRRDSTLINSAIDQFNYEYFQHDSWEWSRLPTSDSKKSLFNFLYRKKSDFIHCDIPTFDLHVNPVLYLSVGYDARLGSISYINARGVELRGRIAKKISFYTFLIDNQSTLPSYVHDFFADNPIVPHAGFWKKYGKKGVDFFEARGYIDFSIGNAISIQFGHDKIFIGNGIRSLILSDHAPAYFFLKTNLKIWKINYLFQLFRAVADAPALLTGSTANDRYPEKYIAIHHASINIGKRFNLGFFESVVFSQRKDNKGSFDIGYLNPIIFYRAIEQQFGSSDNVILGLDFKWLIAKSLSLYGQAIIDELVVRQIFSSRGWWGNKFGTQLGIKYIDAFGVKNLDAQIEYNVVSPYTYSHHTDYGSYSHYRQPMAHPLGANFHELLGVVRYQPFPKLNIVVEAIYFRRGKDASKDENWGMDILKNNKTRQREYGNVIGQGVSTEVYHIDVLFSYMIKHNIYFDIKQIFRSYQHEIRSLRNNTYIVSVSLRWNIAQRHFNF